MQGNRFTVGALSKPTIIERRAGNGNWPITYSIKCQSTCWLRQLPNVWFFHIPTKVVLVTIKSDPERVMGIEPTSSAWKADALAVVLYPRVEVSLSLSEFNQFLHNEQYLIGLHKTFPILQVNLHKNGKRRQFKLQSFRTGRI